MKILITGGASGLGEAITRKLSQDSQNTVYFTYNSSKKKALEITAQFPNAVAWQCDFNQSESIKDLLIKMKEVNIDVLVNNAIANMTTDHFQKINPTTFADSFISNVLPVLIITQEAIRIFRKKRFGRILTILTSYLVNTPPIGLSEYTSNKAYLHAMSKSWATENIKFNITSNCISPSFMLTELTKGTDDRVLDQLKDNHPLKKLLTPEEVACSVKYLLGATENINGINLIVNSGENIL